MEQTLPRPVILPRFAKLISPNCAHQFLVLFSVALLARANSIGDPNYHVDETFYLLVGKAMQAGMAPYIDIWDRKPPGLFVLYWAFANLGSSVVSFQIAGLLFTVGTAVLVTRIADRWVGRGPALLSGGVYIAYLQPLLGGGGQSPVFYNLFVCSAVFLLILSAEKPQDPGNLLRGIGAALLAGIAVSIKPTAVFEGAFVVLGFIWLEWRNRSGRLTTTALKILATGLAACLPVLAIVAWYAANGQIPELLQATVTSNFLKETAPAWLISRTALYLVMVMCPLLVIAAMGWIRGREEGSGQTLSTLLTLWLVAALVGFVAIPNFYSHYALPVVPVLAVLCARYFASRSFGVYIGVGLIGWALLVGQSLDLTRGMRSKAQFDRAAEVIRANLHGGSLYVFDGPPWLYAASGAPWSSRFIFPEHLSNSIERNALGVDAQEEINRILAAEPAVVAVTDSPKPTMNIQNLKILQREIGRTYHIVCAMPLFDFEHHYHLFIYARTSNPDRTLCPAT